jgi:sec-independent protein translocase protein TatA
MVGDLLQPTHLIFVLLVALLVLGPKRLPEVGRSLGRGLRDFRDAMSGLDRDEPALTSPPAAAVPPQPVAAQPANEPAEHRG